MKIFERAQRRLALDYANSLSVAALFLIPAVGFFALDAVGIHALSSPLLALPLLPNILIYMAVRSGRLRWFRGMALPSLLVMTASLALVWLLKTEMQMPAVFAYSALVGLIGAFGFLGYRMWTFDPISRAD